MKCPKCQSDKFYIMNIQNLYCYNCKTHWKEQEKEILFEKIPKYIREDKTNDHSS